jgi:hypothetical protein
MYLNSKMAVFAMSFILSGSIYASTALENTALNRIQNEKAPEHAPLSLVKDGVAQAVVVIPESSGPKAEIYRRSADELIRYIEKATGAKLEIFEENKPLPVGKKLNQNFSGRIGYCWTHAGKQLGRRPVCTKIQRVMGSTLRRLRFSRTLLRGTLVLSG